jgi:putative membrane protein
MTISEQDRARIAAAIRNAEARTTGEIVCVLAQTSTDVTALSVFSAAVVALVLPWVLVASTALPVDQILMWQFFVFFGLAALLLLPAVRVRLLPRKARRAAAHRAAMDQFVERGIARTRDRSGILIFVSLAERYARIIADEGIAARVPQSQWQGAIDALLTHMKNGRIADGFISAVGACGDVLATHFPASGKNPDELPDRIYLI